MTDDKKTQNSTTQSRQTGRCGCGSVVFSVAGDLSSVIACHCRTCRRLSGHFWAATHADRDALTIERSDGLAWWASSDQAERGFCNRCGASLFYRRHDSDRVSIAPGALDESSGLSMDTHICCAEAGDYYSIDADHACFTGPEMSSDPTRQSSC